MSGILVNVALNYYIVLSVWSKLTGALGVAMSVSLMHTMMIVLSKKILTVCKK